MRRPSCRRAITVLLMALLAIPAVHDDAAAQSRSRTKAKKAAPAAKMKAPPVKKDETGPGWRFTSVFGVPTLEYGSGGEGHALIVFSCQPDNKLLRVTASIGSRGLRPGDGAAIRLSSGKLRFEIAGTAFMTEIGSSVEIGAVTLIDPRLFALFQAGETLTVAVPGRSQRLPLRTVGTSANDFAAACEKTERR